MRSSPLAALLAIPALGACVDTSPDRVKLVAEVWNVRLAVQAGALVTSLSGTFDLVLQVGDLASDATIADPPSNQLVVAEDQSSLLTLDALPSSVSFPLTLSSGEKRTLAFTLTDANTLGAADITRLCAGPSQIAVTFTDSLKGGKPTLAESAAVTPSGCP